MKNSVFFLLVIVLPLGSPARDTTAQKSRVTDVSVFFSGAQVTRKADLKIKKGKHLLLIDRLPHEIDPLSIKTSSVAHCKILSVKHVLHKQDEGKKDAAEQAFSGQIEEKEQRIKEIGGELAVFEIEESLLMDNSDLSTENKNLTVAGIREAADFYRARLNEIRKKKLDLNNEVKKLKKDILDIYEKINAITVEKRKTHSQVYITLDCEKDMPGDLSLTYYVSSAGWEPVYDFRVDDITSPFVIVYNANVFQSTGEEWNNVNIRLSSGNPALSGSRRQLIPWYLDQRNPYVKPRPRQDAGSIKGTLRDRHTGESIPFANVVVYREGRQVAVATTNIDGEYLIKPVTPGSYNIKAVYVGYTATEITGISVDAGKVAYANLLMGAAANANLEEVAVTEYQIPLIDPDMKSGRTITREDYQNLATKDINSTAATSAGVHRDMLSVNGGRYGANTYFVDGVKVFGDASPQEVETIYSAGNAVKSAVAGQEYIIDEPYTIPSDGADYTIRIKEASTQVTYLYHAVPKLESDVFLTAEIADWADLNLLSGKSSIYFKNTYVGQSYIDVAQTGDTLSVSLGRDQDVIVSRQGDKKINDKKTTGSSVKETVGWTTTIRNNKKAPVKIIVEDQYPLSSLKSVEVELLESTGANADERKGKLTWDLTIAANEKKSASFKYSVRYPKWARVVAE